jgi:3-hydroxyacyl-CoA dehydrogenase
LFQAKEGCRREIEKTIAREKARKRISVSEEKSIEQKLTLTTDLNQLSNVDLVRTLRLNIAL